MPIDRRDFLKFVVGGALGTIFSPMPWMSMDEVAKWSQRWAPIPEKGEASYLTSTCKLCPGACGIRIRLIEKERAVKIDGNPNHPVNRGGLCPLGLAGLQYLYSEEVRLKTPIMRYGIRGRGEWLSITWEEALSSLTSNLKDLRQKDLSHTVALLDGQGMGSQARLAGRFLKAYGSPNYIRAYQSGDLEEVLTKPIHGVRAHLSYDLPRATHILSFGCALLDGWGNPAWVAQAYQQWRPGPGQERAKLVQIDTMATTTASLADEWIAVKPGTEETLALGLVQVILDKNWTNPAYIQARLSGVEGLKGQLKQHYSPDRVAKITGVSPELIERLGKEFIQAKQPLALWGQGKGDLPISHSEAQAVHLLNVLAGSINRPGGVYLQTDFPYIGQPKVALDNTAEKGWSQIRLDGAFSSQYSQTGNRATALFEKPGHKNPYPINLLMLNEVNPVFTLGEKRFLETAEKIPFIVSFSPFVDETNDFADLILPVPTFLERWDDSYYCQGVPFPVYGLTKPVLPPRYGAKSLGEVFLELAKNLGGKVKEALPFETMEGVIKQASRGLFDSKKGRLADGSPGETGKSGPTSFDSFDSFWNQLVAQGTWYHGEYTPEEGKAKRDLSAISLRTDGLGQAQSPGKNPLYLVPQSLILLQSGYWPNPPFLTKSLGEEILQENRSVVQIHPQTARSLSLQEGDRIEIQASKGKIVAQVHLFEGAQPDCLFIPLGLGHSAFDATLRGRGANPYPILEPVVDPITGLEVIGATRVKIKKA